MKKDKVIILRILLFVLIILWCLIVFNMSHQTGGESSGLSRRIVELFTKNEKTIEIVEPYVRKFAHFSEYSLGGALMISLFSTYQWTDKKKMTVSILIGVWYAIIDEVHQLLVPGRHGSPVDVYIDSLGIACGVCAMLFVIKLVILFKNKNNQKSQVKD